MRLFLILWLVIMPSLAKGNDDLVLDAGAKAPFYGVLVDPDHYREYTEDMRDKDFLEKDANAALIEAQTPSGFSYGFAGLALGIIIGVIIK